MHIGIAGHIATENITRYLNQSTESLPKGYFGAPLLGTLIGELLKRGHTVSAFTTSSDIKPSSTQWVTASGDRFQIHYCGARKHSFRPNGRMLGRAVDFFKIERNCLENAMRAAAPEIIHAHWSYEFGLAALATGLPHVVTCHDAPHVVLRYTPNLYRFFRLLMARKCLGRAKVLTAVSTYLKAEVERYSHVSVSVVPNPLPDGMPNVTTTLRDKTHDLDRPVIVMVLNGWDKRKNPQPALRAFKLIRNRYPLARLELYGSNFGPGQKAETWARSQGLEQGVHFFGPVEYTKLLKRIASAHVLLHPALEETFGMTLAEAMGLGVPVVGGHVSGAVPWVIGEGGVTADVTSAAAIAQAIFALVDDRGSYLVFANAALERVRCNFSVGVVADLYEEQYRIALAT